MISCPYGFRVLDSKAGKRILINYGAALAGYAACEEKAEPHREAYLSAFVYDDDFRWHLQTTGSTRDFKGRCWSQWLWFDLDREGDLQGVLNETRQLAMGLVERYRLDENNLLLFFSGAKGFHVGLPTGLWAPESSTTFHRVARRMAERRAEETGVIIDAGVYDKVRLFRAPNSRHPKTGLYKRQLSFDELMNLKIEAIRKLAEQPEPFELPASAQRNDLATTDWLGAMQQVEQQIQARQQRQAVNDRPTLNRLTLEFIQNGAKKGDRHRLLFSAAKNLAEFDCPSVLAHALLSESALDSGLSPSDVRRQIDCGLTHQEGGDSHG
ncbi:MAG: DNA primase [Phycisphaerales bacterium]|nr:DNA primase [Phycisphaerales bacterium]